MTLTRRHTIALGSTAFGLPSVARAETWPTGPVTILVAYAAGGGPDINARGLAQAMPAVTGQPAIVDNRAGAGGSIGIRAAAGARPDGQTLLYAAAANIVINPWVQRGMIDTLTALPPICQTTAYQYALMVNAQLPVNSIAEVDRAGMRIAVTARSAYDLWLERNIKNAQLVRSEGGDATCRRLGPERLDQTSSQRAGPGSLWRRQAGLVQKRRHARDLGLAPGRGDGVAQRTLPLNRLGKSFKRHVDQQVI